MFNFPWSNFHELNLDWILSVVKEAKEIFTKGEGDIQHAVETADQALETAEQAAAGVIADGAVTIPKVNGEVFNLFAYIVSGSVAPVFIPENALVILRKSTVYNVTDGIYTATRNIPQAAILTSADLDQTTTLINGGGLNYLLRKLDATQNTVDLIEAGLVIIVDGDEASAAVPSGGLAYVKNNTNGLTEGFYTNFTAAPYPATGGTADANIFAPAVDLLNGINATLATLDDSLDDVENTLNLLENGLAIIVEGNSSASGASQGQYVYLKDSTITGCADGLYTAAQAIPAITAIDGTYLSSVSNGGLNSLKSEFGDWLDVPVTVNTITGTTNTITVKKRNGILKLYMDARSIAVNAGADAYSATISGNIGRFERFFMVGAYSSNTVMIVYVNSNSATQAEIKVRVVGTGDIYANSPITCAGFTSIV